ncbi:hypothetical protein BHE74_00044578, partial [Ensete ventricosum]
WITSKGEQGSKTAKHINVMTNAGMEGLGSNDDDNNSSSSRERYTFMGDSCCARYCLGPNPSMARFIYALIFLVTCLLAWTIRDYGRNALSELESSCLPVNASLLPRLKGCHGARYCLGAEGVLRISSGCFVSFRVFSIFWFMLLHKV